MLMDTKWHSNFWNFFSVLINMINPWNYILYHKCSLLIFQTRLQFKYNLVFRYSIQMRNATSRMSIIISYSSMKWWESVSCFWTKHKFHFPFDRKWNQHNRTNWIRSTFCSRRGWNLYNTKFIYVYFCNFSCMLLIAVCISCIS